MKSKVLLLLFIALVINQIYCNVIGIDFGTQTFKIGLIKPGAFEIVLNEQSGRKTFTSVGWYNDERVFASDSFSLWVRNPKQVYQLSELFLGREYENDLVEKIGLGSLGFKVSNDTERNTFNFIYSDEIQYSVEEINGMLFKKIKDLSSTYAGSSVKDCVIAVPPFFNQQQRQAIFDAATLGGLNVLSLINDVNAAAINYAMDRNFNEANQSVIFYDMGYKSTKLSLVHFSAATEPIKNTNKNKNYTTAIVKHLEWDENLGGLDFDMAIVNYLKGLIKTQKPNVDTSDVKLTIKLLKEAAKLKETLSVNQQAQIFIGSLVDEWDFTTSISRQQFEELISDLLKKTVEPLKRLLESNGLTSNDVDYVELIGGSIRIPAIQSVLKTYLNRNVLDKHLNGDEAIASGSSLYAASLTSYFRVKDIRLKDISTTPIDVTLANKDNTFEVHEDESPEEHIQHMPSVVNSPTQHLFKKNNRLGVKKSMTFYSNNTFSLDVNNADNGKPLITYLISGIPVPSPTLNFTGKPKVICSFRLTTSGMVQLEKAEAEILVSVVKIKNNTKSILSVKPTVTDNSADESDDSSDEAPNDSKPEEFLETEVVTKVRQVTLNISAIYHSVVPLSKETLKTSKLKLDALDKADENLRTLRKEKNTLESFIYETRDKLDSDSVIECSTESEREQLQQDLSKSSEWLEDAELSSNNNIEDYKNQYQHIKKKAQKIFNRVEQRQLVPSGLEDLSNLINKFKPNLPTMTKELNITEEELTESLERFETIGKWISTKQSEFQAITDYTKDLPFSSIDIKVKYYELERLMKDLSSKKKKKAPPKPTPKPKSDKNKESSSEKPSATEEQPEQFETNNQEQQNEQEQKHDEL